MSRYYLTYKAACKLQPGDLVQCHAHSSTTIHYTTFGFRVGSICKVIGKAFRSHPHATGKDVDMVSIESPTGKEFMLNDYECGMFHKYTPPKTKA